jgi:hypothetical protein
VTEEVNPKRRQMLFHITWGASVSFAAINGVGIAGRRFRRGFVEKRDGQ